MIFSISWAIIGVCAWKLIKILLMTDEELLSYQLDSLERHCQKVDTLKKEIRK
jgi:hypothetical protein